MNSIDIERLNKAADAAGFLSKDLEELTRAEDPLLAEAAIDLMARFEPVEQRIERVRAVCVEKK